MTTNVQELIREMFDQAIRDTEAGLFDQIKRDKTTRADCLAQLDVLTRIKERLHARIDYSLHARIDYKFPASL